MDLDHIILTGEDSRTQFKQRFGSPDALASEITAMANGEGGIIVVGIGDNGAIVGIDNIRELNQMISNACSQKIEPPLSVFTENLTYKDKLIALIKVPQGSNKPYAANKRDFWIKVGADKRRATREELKRLMQASGDLYADEMAVHGTGISDIDMYLFRRFYQEQYGISIENTGLAEQTLLKNLKLMTGNQLTLAGVLLFSQRPELIKPQYVTRAMAFIGNNLSGTSYSDSEDIGGVLSLMFKNGMAFLKRNLHKRQNGQNVNYPGVLEVPEIALEEALVNALIHRDFFINSGVRLFIFDDRVEIISPGSLPNTVNTDNIRHGIQIARNPILLSFVNKLKIPYRGIGSGIMRMIRECDQAGLPAPEFIEDQEAELFKVVFKRKLRIPLKPTQPCVN